MPIAKYTAYSYAPSLLKGLKHAGLLLHCKIFVLKSVLTNSIAQRISEKTALSKFEKINNTTATDILILSRYGYKAGFQIRKDANQNPGLKM